MASIQFPLNPVEGVFHYVTPEKKYQFVNGAWKLHTNNQPLNKLAPVPTFPPIVAEAAPDLVQDNSFWYNELEEVLYFKKVVDNVPMWEAVARSSEFSIAMAAGVIDISSGDLFTKTISGAVTLSVANPNPAGEVTSFVLELTNAGSAAITWWSGINWSGGQLPVLTAAGVDVLGFYSRDGGVTWRGFVMSIDSKGVV